MKDLRGKDIMNQERTKERKTKGSQWENDHSRPS